MAPISTIIQGPYFTFHLSQSLLHGNAYCTSWTIGTCSQKIIGISCTGCLVVTEENWLISWCLAQSRLYFSHNTAGKGAEARSIKQSAASIKDEWGKYFNTNSCTFIYIYIYIFVTLITVVWVFHMCGWTLKTGVFCVNTLQLDISNSSVLWTFDI